MNSSFLSDSTVPLISNELLWFQNIVELSFGSDNLLKIKLFNVLLLLFMKYVVLIKHLTINKVYWRNLEQCKNKKLQNNDCSNFLLFIVLGFTSTGVRSSRGL